MPTIRSLPFFAPDGRCVGVGPGGPEDLGIALAQNTYLKALVVHGYHDMTTNRLLSRYVLEQATRGPGARKRLFFGTYAVGHMFYLRATSRAELAADVRGFLQAP